MSEGNSSAELNSGQALVLSGGGARAAYQVGCLRALSQALPNYRPQILTWGISGSDQRHSSGRISRLLAGQRRSSGRPLATHANR
jgi:hypothetical protein